MIGLCWTQEMVNKKYWICWVSLCLAVHLQACVYLMHYICIQSQCCRRAENMAAFSWFCRFTYGTEAQVNLWQLCLGTLVLSIALVGTLKTLSCQPQQVMIEQYEYGEWVAGSSAKITIATGELCTTQMGVAVEMK